MQSKENLTTLCGLSGEETELDFSGQELGDGDAVLIANDISDMRALTKLDISENALGAGGCKAIVGALKGNSTLTELNMAETDMTDDSSDWGDMLAVIALADIIPGMRALTSLDISENSLYAEGTKLLAGALKNNQIMTALNISSNDITSDGVGYVDMSGVAALADAMPGMRAMSKLNLSENSIITRQAGKALADMLKANSVLTELNISNCADYTGDSDGPGFAQELAVGISGNGALTKLTFGDKQMVTMTTVTTEASFSGKLESYEAQIVAAFLPKCT
jgi:hypothetical protein